MYLDYKKKEHEKLMEEIRNMPQVKWVIEHNRNFPRPRSRFQLLK